MWLILIFTVKYVEFVNLVNFVNPNIISVNIVSQVNFGDFLHPVNFGNLVDFINPVNFVNFGHFGNFVINSIMLI